METRTMAWPNDVGQWRDPWDHPGDEHGLEPPYLYAFRSVQGVWGWQRELGVDLALEAWEILAADLMLWPDEDRAAEDALADEQGWSRTRPPRFVVFSKAWGPFSSMSEFDPTLQALRIPYRPLVNEDGSRRPGEVWIYAWKEGTKRSGEVPTYLVMGTREEMEGLGLLTPAPERVEA